MLLSQVPKPSSNCKRNKPKNKLISLHKSLMLFQFIEMSLSVLHFLEKSELIATSIQRKASLRNLMTEFSLMGYLLRRIRSAAVISDVCCSCYSTNYYRDPSTNKVEPKKLKPVYQQLLKCNGFFSVTMKDMRAFQDLGNTQALTKQGASGLGFGSIKLFSKSSSVQFFSSCCKLPLSHSCSLPPLTHRH